MEPDDYSFIEEISHVAGEWLYANFDERQRKEIALDLIYSSSQFNHGTDGHNSRIIIAKLAELCTRFERDLKMLQGV